MNPTLQKILASIVTGLILPLLLFRFQVNPWSTPWRYWNIALLCFGVSYLVYKFKQPGDEGLSPKAHLINFVISFVVLSFIAVGYFLILILLYSVV